MTSATPAKCRDTSERQKLDLENLLSRDDLPSILSLSIRNFLDMLETEGICQEDQRQRVAGAFQLIFAMGWTKGYSEGMDDFDYEEELCPDCRKKEDQ